MKSHRKCIQSKIWTRTICLEEVRFIVGPLLILKYSTKTFLMITTVLPVFSLYLRINHRVLCLLETDRHVLFFCQSLTHIFVHPAAVFLRVYACIPMRLNLYCLLHFHLCHLFPCGRIKAQMPVSYTSSILVSGPHSPALCNKAEQAHCKQSN